MRTFCLFVYSLKLALKLAKYVRCMFCLHTRTRWLVVNVSRFLKCRFKILICIDIFIYKVFVSFVPFIFVVAGLTSISFCSHSVWPFSLLCFVINCVSYCSHFVSFSIVILHHANGDFVFAFVYYSALSCLFLADGGHHICPL